MNKSEYLKLEIFIPESHLNELQSALCKADAGHIGNYDSCMSYSPVMSTWRPLPGTNPYSGNTGEISREQELKVEVTIRRDQLGEVMGAVRRVHPYEEPVVNAIPLFYTMRDYLLGEVPPDGKLIDNRLPDWLEEEVSQLVEEVIGKEDYLGRCHRFWAVKKKILHDRYGIDWMTPAEEYPTIIFD